MMRKAASRMVDMRLSMSLSYSMCIQQQVRWRSSLARQRLKQRNKRPLPYHRRQALRKVETVRPEKSLSGHVITSVNHPELLEKHINRANALGTKHGVAQQVAEFDAAAAKFPNPPPVVSCTDMEEWETNFQEVAQRREDELSYEYPQEFWGTYGLEDRDEKKENTKEAAERLGIESSNTQSEMFHDLERYDVDDSETVSSAHWRPAPRETEADQLNDTRSLDRLLGHRLVLLVRRKTDGKWVLPGGIRSSGERMVDAAERTLHATLGNDIIPWYPGNAPMGFWLKSYDEERQQERQCFGEKMFFYRAEILNGKVKLQTTQDEDIEGQGCEEYDDFVWLTRDEVLEKGLLDPPFDEYIHGIFGRSVAEEKDRRDKAQGKIANTEEAASADGTVQ